ncbi:HNH endonuclease [Flagellimonas sp. W118]|uniref:HNH endonuclease n=1 Tax=Flagellimonas sp. W118 TaxID=3410791 RepID=UPI003BF4713E
MGKWTEDIEKALIELGGLGHYSDLYEKISDIRKGQLTKDWKSVVRRTIQQHSSDSESFLKKEDLFYSVNGIGSGVWGLRNYEPTEKDVDLTEDDISFPEGKKLLKVHILRERKPAVVLQAKKRFKEQQGSLFCEVCNFNFEEKYGDLGKDFIEAHHVIPISEMGEDYQTKISDLIMVCSNCHKMIHRYRPWLSKNQIKKLINWKRSSEA